MLSQFLALLCGLVAVHATAKTHWFVFGDSYTWTNFDQSLAQPNDVNPLGRFLVLFSRLVPGYVYHAALNYNTSSTYAYNFARAGATVNATLVTPANPATLIVQVDEFEESYAGPTPATSLAWTGDNSLFSIWFGINDIGGSYLRNIDQPSIIDSVLDSYFFNVKRLVDLGARKILLLNVPPTDRSPLMLARSQGDQAKYKADVLDLNAKLIKRVDAFKLANPKVLLWLVDTHDLVTTILDDPTQYGFVDATSYGAGDNFAWCGMYHVSPAVHAYVAQGIHLALKGSGLL
ncbi:hypothetical protein AURDEDRAFT_173089 [Auricularia subglabra TFB-10046 SS5]|nr:hypothetical protein AURDEDRAFT_173089 [Auricularia subglabra TFB-10046 SS5]